MRDLKYVLSIAMTILGAVYILFSIGFTFIIFLQIAGDDASPWMILFILLINTPPVLLLYYGQRIRKKVHQNEVIPMSRYGKAYLYIGIGVLLSALSITVTFIVGKDLFDFILLFLILYLPSYQFLMRGYRMRKNLKLEELALSQPVPQCYPVHNYPPFQQQTEPKTIIKVVKVKPDPVPKKAVPVECKGCGARKAVIRDELSFCDYCGSPLTSGA
ncbi:hypothetical protein D3P09_14230 [Paenibacillus pinisoli]|uniref:Uncharacterized protein n=1 Tax=Paenibacillus pinisoli TaxID=1276110 RepID=A0A3A6PK54_9BACL|nr:hypothetical protein [Paenibacillus pinisoli]RJX38699.1 hypothetical protein D3P09_14230 [Paenibacillus pinisoli]